MLCAIDRSILCRLWLGSQASVRRLECESAWVALLALLYREESAVDDAWLFIRLLQESGDGSAARAVLLKALAGACRAGPGRAGSVPFPVRLEADRPRLPSAAHWQAVQFGCSAVWLWLWLWLWLCPQCDGSLRWPVQCVWPQPNVLMVERWFGRIIIDRIMICDAVQRWWAHRTSARSEVYWYRRWSRALENSSILVVRLAMRRASSLNSRLWC